MIGTDIIEKSEKIGEISIEKSEKSPENYIEKSDFMFVQAERRQLLTSCS